MNVVCEKCGGKIKIPDERVPQGKSFSINCPKCKNKITIDGSAPEKAKAQPAGGGFSMTENDTYDAPDSRFDFLDEGAETALLCEPDEDIRKKLFAVLDEYNYRIVEPESPRDALKQMRFHDFDVVVLNEKFGTRDPDANHVLKYLSQLQMVQRRKMFVVLINERFKTMDSMSAFNKSVNLVFNVNDIDHFSQVLRRATDDNTTFYRVFKEILQKVGRS